MFVVDDLRVKLTKLRDLVNTTAQQINEEYVEHTTSIPPRFHYLPIHLSSFVFKPIIPKSHMIWAWYLWTHSSDLNSTMCTWFESTWDLPCWASSVLYLGQHYLLRIIKYSLFLINTWCFKQFNRIFKIVIFTVTGQVEYERTFLKLKFLGSDQV